MLADVCFRRPLRAVRANHARASEDDGMGYYTANNNTRPKEREHGKEGFQEHTTHAKGGEETKQENWKMERKQEPLYITTGSPA